MAGVAYLAMLSGLHQIDSLIASVPDDGDL